MTEDLTEKQSNKTVTAIGYCQPSEVNNVAWRVFREQHPMLDATTVFSAAFGVLGLWSFVSIFSFGMRTENSLLQFDSSTSIAFSMICICPFLAMILLRKIFKDRASTTFERDRRYSLVEGLSFSDKGIQYNLPGFSTLLIWRKFTRCIEFPEVFFFATDRFGIFLPKRCFLSEQDVDTVRQIIISNKLPYKKIGKEKVDISYAKLVMKPAGEPQSNATAISNEAADTAGEADSSGVLNGASSQPLRLSDAAVFGGYVARPTEQVLTFECSYTLDELQKIDRLMFFTNFVPSFGIKALGLVLLSILSISAIRSLFTHEGGLGALIYCARYSWVSLFVLAGFLSKVYEARRKVLHDLVNLDQPFQMAATETLLQIRGRRSLVTYSWKQFTECVETPEYFICYLKVGSVVLPKRVLDDRAKLAFLSNVLNKNVVKFRQSKF